MEKILIVSKKVKLDFKNQDVSTNDIDIEDIIRKYSNEYIIDINNYVMTVVNDNLIVTFKLTLKK